MVQAIPRSKARLTERQQFWLDHLRVCREQGHTLRGYAKAHGLSVSGLYTAHLTLKSRGVACPGSSSRSHRAARCAPDRPLQSQNYLDNQWEALVRFCDHGRYGIDTNPIENAIRPFVVGRRNWLFADTVAGANASARLYLLIETAKANGLEPNAYLRHVFTELPKAQSIGEVETLLPTRLDSSRLTRDPFGTS